MHTPLASLLWTALLGVGPVQRGDPAHTLLGVLMLQANSPMVQSAALALSQRGRCFATR
jgi:hypothetical protein